MKGKKITGAAILLFAGLALALYFLKKDPLREVHALWEETMSRTEGAYVQTVTGSAWETKDEGGRHTPFFNNYRPQFYFRTTDVTGVCELPAGTEMCMPGDNVEMTIELIHPVAMEQGLRFAIREGGRTVGSGRVATIIE